MKNSLFKNSFWKILKLFFQFFIFSHNFELKNLKFEIKNLLKV